MRNGMYTDTDGNRYWYRDDRLHRTDGAAIEWANGDRWWYRNRVLHRDDGPAVERVNGTCEWYVDGDRHRADGPAIERSDGTRGWHWRDEYCSFHEWLRLNTELTPQQKTVLMLKYGNG